MITVMLMIMVKQTSKHVHVSYSDIVCGLPIGPFQTALIIAAVLRVDPANFNVGPHQRTKLEVLILTEKINISSFLFF